MGWSFSLKDKKGKCLLEKYGIHYRLAGLAPNCSEDTDAVFRLDDIRMNANGFKYAEKYPEIAKDAVKVIKNMLKANLEALNFRKHCDTCICEFEDPRGWSIEEINKFLNIDLDEVYSFHAGY